MTLRGAQRAVRIENEREGGVCALPSWGVRGHRSGRWLYADLPGTHNDHTLGSKMTCVCVRVCACVRG